MDPNALLDYALFQLTPTRTRCDLVVFSGGKSEKLASGLVEPFVSHLKFAKDQIPKGGYSITLRPPTSNASWFTKSTFLRFVRFVSTPEVLERFARLEKEILQIESSVQPNEFANGNAAGQAEEGTLSPADGIIKKRTNSHSPKLKGEMEGTCNAIQEENSKIRLQRLLETRKAILRKEQAMAYARALAAGFGLDDIDDLIFFSDAFGASRLREACTDFMDLCKKKNTDGLWMDELAAMEACPPSDLSFMGTSGIILSGDNTGLYHNFQRNGSLDISSEANSDSNKESNLSPSDQVPPASAKVQSQMPWPNQIPPYMYNFQGPVQQMHPYQAYPFPGMQHVPPYYPANMHWPQNMDEAGHGLTREPDHRRHQRSSLRKKENSPNAEGPETSEEDEQTESSDSLTGIDSEVPEGLSKEQPYKKKHRKKSSKTVVIRNINYITSNRRNEEKDGVAYDSSSVEDELVDGDSIKMQVEDAVGSLEKHHKSTSKNHKKSGGNKKLVNGFNDSYNLDLETDPVTKTLEGGKGNENWDAFQNLLMSEKESTITSVESQQHVDVLDEHFKIKSSSDSVKSGNIHSVDFDSEIVQRRRTFETDSFVATQRNEVNEGRVNHLEDFGNGETVRANMKRRDFAEDTLFFPHKSEESRSMHVGRLSDCGMESSRIKNGMGEDWFIVNHSGRSESQDATMKQTMFDGGYAVSSEGGCAPIETGKKNVPVDDSFMVQAHTSVADQSGSHWKTDITMDLDLDAANQPENGTPDASHGAYEPDDLCVMLTRNSGFESSRVSWSPEMDYGNEVSFTEADKKSSVLETNNQIEENALVESESTNAKKSVVPGTANSAKQSRSKGLQGSVAKSKFNVISQGKKSIPTNRPMIQKSKLEKEEEARKRAEELLIERQKRIAGRTAVGGLTPAASKKIPVGSKLNSPKSGVTNSSKTHPVPGQPKQNGGSPASKSNQLKKTSMKANGVVNA